MGIFSKKSSKPEHRSDSSDAEPGQFKSVGPASPAVVKRATRTRWAWCVTSSVFLFITVIFMIMVEIGNVADKPVLRDLWFISLNLSEVIPLSTPNASLLNSVAQTLGLHDFYQVGLWNYCEGYESSGISDCLPTQTLYWFDPVDIIVNQLLAGASIEFPAEIKQILDIIRVASHVMFGLFLTGACLSFVLIPFMLLAVRSRWVSFVYMFLTFINALCIIAASVIATVMFVIMRNVFNDNSDVNIQATLGTKMFAMMWVASAFALFTFLIQMCLACCCASRRDVRRGKKRGSEKAYR